MGIELNGTLSDFATVAQRLDLPGWPTTLGTENLPAPHKPKALPPGRGAIYIFALADASTA